MNTATKRQYLTLCPQHEETRSIQVQYEDYRKKMVNEGIKPPSLSRYLINIILNHCRDINDGDFK